MGTMLKRTGTTSYSAMLAVKNEQGGWATPTLLLHFVEQSQASTVFITTAEARSQFEKCEPGRIYDVEVPGKCVRTSSGQRNYGVQSRYEVTLKFAPKTWKLSKAAWPLAFPYRFSAWSVLNQAAADTFIDMLGGSWKNRCGMLAVPCPNSLCHWGTVI